MSKKKGRLIIISAPSGTGKSTLIRRLMELRRDLVLSVSATTRSPRKGEEDGVSYYFVTRERFLEMIGREEFLEYAEYVGEFYGTPKKPIYENIGQGKDILLEIEVQGAKQIVEKEPDSISVFIIPPDIAELERRLRGRGTDSAEKLAARLERARLELEEKVHYSYVVVNDDVTRAAEEIISIIDSVHSQKNTDY